MTLYKFALTLKAPITTNATNILICLTLSRKLRLDIHIYMIKIFSLKNNAKKKTKKNTKKKKRSNVVNVL